MSVRIRLHFTALGATLAVYLLDISIAGVDIWGVDYLFSIPLVAILFTAFAITGLANAYNIIDGFNGLSSMVCIITLLGLAFVSYSLQDTVILNLSLIMLGAILGFFVWNYPKGLIFLGDGGAYLIGFWVATLSILMVARHPSISPWFALLINAYPILETVFTIYRRKIHQGKNPGLPDGIHFHTLIYRRILNSKRINNKSEMLNAHSKTAPIFWFISSLAVIPAVIYRQSTPTLIAVTLLFSFTYIWIYKRIVKFKTPIWINLLLKT
jgi:UDP-N-acetylmuramyl pentapeptide phosphotransferase/UDP-N-acetylglucosamine-1-phosphate transferase